MFNRAVVHYPTDEQALSEIKKEVAAFHRAAAIKYIEGLKLTDVQIQELCELLDRRKDAPPV